VVRQDSEVTWTHAALPKILDLIPRDGGALLDVGCGRGIVGALCRIYRNYSRLVGLDAYRPYLDFCRRHGFYDELVEWDLRELPLPFADGTFDVVTAVEVIEHLEKQPARNLLAELERVGSTVVVTTPNGFFHQEAYDGNEWQKHRSGWTADELRSLGYRVTGGGGLLILGRRVRGLSTVLGGFARLVPGWGEFLLCVKETKQRA
jgi:2-polyprenyl-3-methyl-5-hydroxy-6-metoxy-1,4-benzoquinol methylase